MTSTTRIFHAVGKLMAGSLALACASAHAIDPGTFTPGFGVYYTAVGGAPNLNNLTCNTFAPCGRSTPYANLFGTASVVSGPVITTTVDTAGWNDSVPDYNGFALVGGMEGTLDYTFLVAGPTAMAVPITVTGAINMGFRTGDAQYGVNGAASASSSVTAASSTGSLFSFTSGERYDSRCNATNLNTCNTGFTLHLTVNSGSEFGYIKMLASSSFSGAYIGASAAYATVDPLVRIDPAFLAVHPGYSLVFPDGLANQLAPVPEPAAGLLLAAGLAGLAGLSRWSGAVASHPER